MIIYVSSCLSELATVALQRPEGIEAQLEALIPLVQWRARWALGARPPSPAAALPPVRLYNPRVISTPTGMRF